ncbi:hypothetical protein L1987_47001 [Smallanthus sonchifolius]|uniref:Uncharacterized protein n=1 Tax=Smallanthus sonchifolius TaxID=185202 RepID=A0ACB9G0P9_9ASTR|nr:hypothetical protein L1987_47001 [Smallanthus sonchifolius]
MHGSDLIPHSVCFLLVPVKRRNRKKIKHPCISRSQARFINQDPKIYILPYATSISKIYSVTNFNFKPQVLQVWSNFGKDWSGLGSGL